VSFAVLPNTDDELRLGLEALSIAKYRAEVSASPLANFGRMPPGWKISSYRRGACRGGKIIVAPHPHRASIPPRGPLGSDPIAAKWCGHDWSPWVALAGASTPSTSGLYRLRGGAAPSVLLYVGEGAIGARLRSHGRKAAVPKDRQGQVFATNGVLEASWVADATLSSPQRKELEMELIGAHVAARDRPPKAQFLGNSGVLENARRTRSA
jgi:hypothetical protein